ncbi:MFS transporter [Patulibacter sp. NPDC049589]|uniref:MFS transporter n=1 Tax=Patulibacter sp. NPDC049589 TaxID=3154731 RepID=UPI0034222079
MSVQNHSLGEPGASPDRFAPGPPRPSRLVMPVLLLAVFVMPISISGTAIALPSIADDLGSSPTGLQWIVNAFNATFAVFTLFWGVFSDRLGYRRTFTIGIATIVVASLLSAVASSLGMLVVARALAGVGGAAVFTGAAAILSNAYAGPARTRAFAFFGTTIGLGLALGPTISGALVSAAGWRGIFVAYAVVLVAPLVGAAVLPHVRHDDVRRRLIDVSLLRNPRFLGYALVPVAAAVGYVTMLSYLPVALSAIHGMSAGTAGLFMLPMTIPVLLGPAIAARLVDRHERVTPMTMMYASLGSMVLGDLGLLLLGPDIGLAWLVLPLILLGFGFGFPIGLVDGEALASVAPHLSGTAAGVVNFLRLGSEAIVVGLYAAAITALIGARIPDAATADRVAAGGSGNAAAYADALHPVVVVMAVVVVAMTVLIAVLDRAARRPERRVGMPGAADCAPAT